MPPVSLTQAVINSAVRQAAVRARKADNYRWSARSWKRFRDERRARGVYLRTPDKIKDLNDESRETRRHLIVLQTFLHRGRGSQINLNKCSAAINAIKAVSVNKKHAKGDEYWGIYERL